MIVESIMFFGSELLKEILEDKNQEHLEKNIKQVSSKQLTPFEEVIGVIRKIIKMPNNKIKEMISVLEYNLSNKKSYKKREKNKYSLTYVVKGYLDWDERKILRKIGSNKDLKELLEFILDMKINKECFKELKECSNKLNQEEQKIVDLKEKIENEQKEYINQLIKQIEEKDKKLNYLEKKQNNLDQFIQEQIDKKLNAYKEKLKELEKENKELKEILGFYE